MKREVVFTFIIMLALAPACFAQVARNASPSTVSYEAKTNLGNLGIQGLDVTGNPAYFEMRSTDAAASPYYLWINSAGNLCLASHGTIGVYASFPTGSWDSHMGCTVVGGQS